MAESLLKQQRASAKSYDQRDLRRVASMQAMADEIAPRSTATEHRASAELPVDLRHRGSA